MRTPEGNLQRIMRHLNGVYTQSVNRSEQKEGPLFRGRYQAIPVDAQAYGLALSRCIHRTPLAARRTRRLNAYRWSRYRAYVGNATPPAWLYTRYGLRAIGRRNPKARYPALVAGDTDAALKEFYPHSKVRPIPGDESFKHRALGNIVEHPDVPALRAARHRPAVSDIVKTVAHY